MNDIFEYHTIPIKRLIWEISTGGIICEASDWSMGCEDVWKINNRITDSGNGSEVILVRVCLIVPDEWWILIFKKEIGYYDII